MAFFNTILPKCESNLRYNVTWYVSSSPCVTCADRITEMLKKNKNLRLTIMVGRLFMWEEPEMQAALKKMKSAGCKLRIMKPQDFEYVWQNFVEQEEGEEAKAFVPWEDIQENFQYYEEKLAEILHWSSREWGFPLGHLSIHISITDSSFFLPVVKGITQSQFQLLLLSHIPGWVCLYPNIENNPKQYLPPSRVVKWEQAPPQQTLKGVRTGCWFVVFFSPQSKHLQESKIKIGATRIPHCRPHAWYSRHMATVKMYRKGDFPHPSKPSPLEKKPTTKGN